MVIQRFSPLASSTVPSWQPRFVAGVTAALLVTFVLGGPAWLLVPLLPDFAARALDRRSWSGLGRAGTLLVPRLLPARAARSRSYWPPKRFAARLGLGLLSAILGANAASAHDLALGLAGAMAALSALEAAFGFCVACKLYSAFGRRGWVDACPDGQCTVPR
jgi:hypothetical protein